MGDNKGNKQNNKTEGNEGKLFFNLLVLLFIVMTVIYLIKLPEIVKSTESYVNKAEVYTEKKETKKGVILGTEAVCGSSNVEYNTYIKLENDDIMRVTNDNVYTYAKFNTNKKVDVEITKGKLKKGNENGEEDTELRNTEKSKYISDVLVEGKSIKYID